MLFDLLTGFITLLQKHNKEKLGHNYDLIHIRKRQLVHQNIPDLNSIKTIVGEKFDELQNIFNRFDPIKSEKLAENPNK